MKKKILLIILLIIFIFFFVAGVIFLKDFCLYKDIFSKVEENEKEIKNFKMKIINEFDKSEITINAMNGKYVIDSNDFTYYYLENNILYVINKNDKTYSYIENEAGVEHYLNVFKYLDNTSFSDLKISKEIVDEQECYCIAEKNSSKKIWINTNTFLPVREYFDKLNDNKILIEKNIVKADMVELPDLSEYTKIENN